jgi:hypothetical protein
MWLMSQNNLMTRDNLKKRNMNKPEECAFCCDDESISHLFHECVVAKVIWKSVSKFFGIHLGLIGALGLEISFLSPFILADMQKGL